MSSQNTDIVVYGYIHEFQSHISRNCIVAVDIINICCLYFANALKVFLHLFTDSGQQLLSILDIQLKSISQLIESNENNLANFGRYLSSKFCYVSNISSYFNIDSIKQYDGFVGAETILTEYCDEKTNHEMIKPTMILFESNKIDNDIIKYIKIRSESQSDLHHEMYLNIFCGRNNGVIYEKYGDLFQLKLENVNLENRYFNFNKIETEKPFWDCFEDSWLSMCYLNNQNKIFAIQCKNFKANIDSILDGFTLKTDIDSKTVEKVSKCAIFDFIKYEWKSIANYKYKFIENDVEDLYSVSRDPHTHKLCANRYDKNIIYVISNRGTASKYHFQKNEWEILSDECAKIDPFNRHIVWMNNCHILCCSDGTYFAYLDLRDKAKKWCKMDDIIQITNNFVDKTFTNSIFPPTRKLFL